MNKRVKELQEVIKQLKNSITALTNSISTDTTGYFSVGYNQALGYAINLYRMDIQVIEAKIKLIEDEQI